MHKSGWLHNLFKTPVHRARERAYTDLGGTLRAIEPPTETEYITVADMGDLAESIEQFILSVIEHQLMYTPGLGKISELTQEIRDLHEIRDETHRQASYFTSTEFITQVVDKINNMQVK